MKSEGKKKVGYFSLLGLVIGVLGIYLGSIDASEIKRKINELISMHKPQPSTPPETNEAKVDDDIKNLPSNSENLASSEKQPPVKDHSYEQSKQDKEGDVKLDTKTEEVKFRRFKVDSGEPTAKEKEKWKK